MKKLLQKRISKKIFLRYVAVGLGTFMFGGMMSLATHFSQRGSDANYNRGGYGGKTK